MTDKLLEVQDLQVSFTTFGGAVQAVRGVSFDLHRGECLAIVGESGCGKSVAAQTIMRLIPMPPGRITGGSIRFAGRELIGLDERQMLSIRGAQMGMIFQDPMTSLNPTMTVGRQIAEGVRKHLHLYPAAARARAVEMLGLVGLPQPEQRMNAFPHQFSGGMRQRVMIALAMAPGPRLLIADEPTTALDVTVQAQILELMKDLKKNFGTAIILITHDLGVVAGMADRVAVMYAGQIVESGVVDDVFHNPRHPYTWGLLGSIPRLHLTEDRPLTGIPGTPPDLYAPPAACAFAARCPYAMSICTKLPPGEHGDGTHRVRCWLEHPQAPRAMRRRSGIGADLAEGGTANEATG